MVIWIIELEKVDVIMDVFLLSSHQILPRKGHREAVLSTACYGELKGEDHFYDQIYPEIDHDWSEFFWYAKKLIPLNASKPRGQEVNLRTFVDSNQI